MDNTTVVSYINHQRWLHSHPLFRQGQQILLWAETKLLSLRAVYILWHANVKADILLRQGLSPREWRLYPQVVETIWQRYGQAEVDLFTSKVSAHYSLWFALTPPAPLGLDAMVHMWLRLCLHVFPPTALLWGVLATIRQD